MLRRFLSLPAAYRFAESLLISERSRREIFDRFVQARAGQRVLDLGCGTGVALHYLPAVDYVGVDINAEYIEAARAAFPAARFVCGSFEAAGQLEGGFDRVVAIGVLHHLPDREVLELARMARGLLAAGGALVTIDGYFHAGQPWFARMMLERDRGEFVRDREGYIGLVEQVFDEVVATERRDLLRVPYSHLILQARA